MTAPEAHGRGQLELAEMLLEHAADAQLGSDAEQYLVAKAHAHAAVGTGLILAAKLEQLAVAVDGALETMVAVLRDIRDETHAQRHQR